jgi:hypothetical protein
VQFRTHTPLLAARRQQLWEAPMLKIGNPFIRSTKQAAHQFNVCKPLIAWKANVCGSLLAPETVNACTSI